MEPEKKEMEGVTFEEKVVYTFMTHFSCSKIVRGVKKFSEVHYMKLLFQILIVYTGVRAFE